VVLAQSREQVKSSIDEIEALTQRAEFDRLSRLLDVLIPTENNDENKIDYHIPVKVTLNLRPGQLSPAQQRQWDRAWQRLIVQAKRSEAESEGHEFLKQIWHQ